VVVNSAALAAAASKSMTESNKSRISLKTLLFRRRGLCSRGFLVTSLASFAILWRVQATGKRFSQFVWLQRVGAGHADPLTWCPRLKRDFLEWRTTFAWPLMDVKGIFQLDQPPFGLDTFRIPPFATWSHESSWKSRLGEWC
jgi:hypothetical protein